MEFSETPDPFQELRSSISRAVDNKSSIELRDVENVAFTISFIQQMLDYRNLRYRIRTDKRSSLPKTAAGSGAAIIGASVAIEAAAIAAPTLIAATAIAGAALTGVGAVALAGIAVHRLLTSNPDYELVHFPQERVLKLIYKK